MILQSLTRFTKKKKPRTEQCELCAAPLPTNHRHVVDRADRRLLCACSACGFAFVGAAAGRFRTVPAGVRASHTGAIELRDLQALGVPVGVAFFFRASNLGRWMGVFPSPAGPTEAELPEGAWERLVEKSSLVRSIEDDVEALLVSCTRDGRCIALVVPIDVCYELTALVRRTWQGFDGGDAARVALDAFFAALAERAREEVTP